MGIERKKMEPPSLEFWGFKSSQQPRLRGFFFFFFFFNVLLFLSPVS